MVKDIREVTDNGMAITNDEEDIRVAQVDGLYADADMRPDDEEDRLGTDPNHPHEDDREEDAEDE
jgi:hypothetical protein